jgi:hypothetical protein
MRMKRFQWVWYGFGDMMWGFERPGREHGGLALIYRWRLYLGPLEVRRWEKWDDESVQE